MESRHSIGSVQSNAKPDPVALVKKYLKLVWQKKMWIFFITILVTVIWTLVFYLYIQKSQQYSTSAIVKFNDPRHRFVGALTDFAPIGVDGSEAILKSNSFLTKVVDSLHLNLSIRTTGINRFDFFKSITLSQDAKYGIYAITHENGELKFLFSNASQKLQNEVLASFSKGELDSDLTLKGYGLELIVDAATVNSFERIEFGLNPIHIYVPYFGGQLVTKLDRPTRTLLTITYAHNHPVAAARILNTTVNMFIDKLLEVKRFRTTSVLKSLEEQLIVSREDLRESETAIRQFREQNPYLFLSSSGSNIVSDLSDAQGTLTDVSYSLNRAESIAPGSIGEDFSNQAAAFIEILSYLEEKNIAGAQTLNRQYTNYMNERSQLLSQNYSPQHPDVLELESRLESLQSQISNKLAEHTNQMRLQKNELEGMISQNQSNLRRLPRSELRLAEFERDREVKSRIYSNILVRFNEAKVSDAAVISDALIIDDARVPIVYGNGMSKLVFVGPLLGLILGMAIFILIDLLDKSVREENDVTGALHLPVLAKLPIIGDEDDIPVDMNMPAELDPKLITSDYAPSIAGESFRLIRTKLFMESQSEKKSLIIASLTSGEGKSLISCNLAITCAQQKLSTVLIDCDLRRGVLHKSLNCKKKAGLADVLALNTEINESVISQIIQKTHVPNLALISSGVQVPNPSELLGSNRMKKIHELLEQNFDIVIIDSPPVEFLPDTFVLNSFIHNIMLVIRYGRTPIKKISDKLEEFAEFQRDFRGVVINAAPDVGDKHYSYSYYHY